jgi:hypothetical protein
MGRGWVIDVVSVVTEGVDYTYTSLKHHTLLTVLPDNHRDDDNSGWSSTMPTESHPAKQHTRVRISRRRPTDDAHPAAPVGTGDGLHRPPAPRERERNSTRAHSAVSNSRTMSAG